MGYLYFILQNIWNHIGNVRPSDSVRYRGRGTYNVMRVIYILSSIVMGCSIVLFGSVKESFSITLNSSGPTLNGWSVVAGDIDNDGDVDLVVGTYGFQSYENNGNGVFSLKQSVSLPPGLNTMPAALGDIDNDGDLDLISYDDRIYKNDGYGYFSEYQKIPSSGMSWSYEFGDIDGDGDIDLVSGKYTGQLYENVKVHKNDGTGKFFDTGQYLVKAESVALGDIDNDGDKDLITGNISSVFIYKNNGTGEFLLSDTLSAYGNRDIILGDIDNDGDLDFVAACDSLLPNKVFKNDGNGLFTDTGNDFGAGLESFSIVFGDLDNDGDLDIVEGQRSSCTCLRDILINLNDGTGIFSATERLGGDITTGIALGDFDNDSDLDFAAVTGKLYFNNAIVNNTTPIAPTILDSFISGNSVTLSWGEGTDYETPSAGLTYNIKIGIVAGANEIFSSIIPVGYGNVGHSYSHMLKNLPNGAYFWSIQTIDSGFKKSSYALEKTFTITGNNAPILNTTAYFCIDKRNGIM